MVLAYIAYGLLLTLVSSWPMHVLRPSATISGCFRTPSLHVKRARPSSSGCLIGPTKHDLGRNGNLTSGRPLRRSCNRCGCCARTETKDGPQVLNFSALLIPTMDSVRAEYILDIIAKHDVPSPKESDLVLCQCPN